MNTKRKATAAVLFILMLTVVSVGVVVAHHNGLYLNYDSGKQKAQAGKENYAHLWWVQLRCEHVLEGRQPVAF